MNRQDFYTALTANNLDKYKAKFEPLIKDTIRYSLTPILDYNDVPVGSSRMGGTPDLPAGMTWPTDNNDNYLSFIAQLNLREIKPYDTYRVLPDTGYLYFFFDAAQNMGGYSKDEKHLFKVIYFDGTAEGLDFPDYPDSMAETAKYYACSLAIAPQISLPYKWGREMSFMNSEERDIYSQHVWQDGNINKTLGHADRLQDEMEVLCQIVTSESFDGDFRKFDDPQYDQLKAGAQDWLLLLQIDSNPEDAYMMWGNLGRLYFWIRKQDLEKKNFDNCWCVLQDM